MTVAIKKISGCIGCKKCIETCPVDVLRFNEKKKCAEIRYRKDCQVCNLCVIYCPVNAIYVDNEKKADVLVSWR